MSISLCFCSIGGIVLRLCVVAEIEAQMFSFAQKFNRSVYSGQTEPPIPVKVTPLGEREMIGGISSRSLKPVFYYLHHRILTWVLKKYESFKGSKVKAIAWLRAIEKSYPNLFYHWELGYKLF